MSPYPGMKSAIGLQAWGRQLFVENASDSRVDTFLDAYTRGPQAPENAACSGNTTTGPLQEGAPTTAVTVPPTTGQPVPSPSAN